MPRLRGFHWYDRRLGYVILSNGGKNWVVTLQGNFRRMMRDFLNLYVERRLDFNLFVQIGIRKNNICRLRHWGFQYASFDSFVWMYWTCMMDWVVIIHRNAMVLCWRFLLSFLLPSFDLPLLRCVTSWSHWLLGPSSERMSLSLFASSFAYYNFDLIWKLNSSVRTLACIASS